MRRINPNQLLLPLGGTTCMPTPLSRATSQRSRYVEAPAPKAWLCIVLAVDTAKRSGWSIAACGVHVDSGEVETLDEPTLDQIVLNALQLGESRKLPVVLVLESPWGGNVAIVAGLGVARERWLRAWRNAGQAPGRVLRVQPSTWRGPVLGRHATSLPREEVRALELQTARALVKHPVGADEAPAILIARWAAHAARVGRAIGKRASKASLRAWTRRR